MHAVELRNATKRGFLMQNIPALKDQLFNVDLRGVLQAKNTVIRYIAGETGGAAVIAR